MAWLDEDTWKREDNVDKERLSEWQGQLDQKMAESTESRFIHSFIFI